MIDKIPKQELLYLDRIKKFVQEELNPISLQVETSGEIPEAIVEKMRRLGLFGLAIPGKYGGLGLSTLGEILVYEELTQTNACFRSRIGTSNSIGSMGILFDGTEDQKKKYLPWIAQGERTAAFALTEPDAGSDAANIQCRAVLDGDHWLLNGTKQFITNGDCAGVITTIAVTDDNKRARGGFTAFIVENDFPGLCVSPPDRKMGLRGSHTNELVFRNCRVPRENVIGGPSMVGQGFNTAMRVLDKGRLTMGACALGASQKLLEYSRDHIRHLIQSGKPRDDLQAARFSLADMATEIFAARRMLYETARLRDTGKNVTQEASMVKLFCTEMASRIADRAMGIFEDEGYLTKNQIEMFLRDVRLYRIFEGTSEIQRMVIARNLLKD
ncbi:MAG: acyl-CoA dehydrogenase family protein [Deltaproteobacteria bacterium]|jgi:acyl-CoA dehydrogenase|nr:acyl-CoA dehydrogenase family protein [Deltaproteobacteria bacterium]MBW2479321.1 acyl-CoA dehydrogenase family protein [Deltaproteobacteria bacterium]